MLKTKRLENQLIFGLQDVGSKNKTPRGLNRTTKVPLFLREETPNVRETRSKMDNSETLALVTMRTQTSR
jgi:hypothetical protein